MSPALSLARFETLEAIEAFVALFRRGELPKGEWNHHAHLVVGLWHGVHHPPPVALEMLRGAIRTHNETVGTANSDTGGYHESITRLYVLGIAAFLRERESPPISPELMRALLHSKLGGKEWPLEFYSKPLLFSVEARRHWIEPDLQPAPSAGPSIPPTIPPAVLLLVLLAALAFVNGCALPKTGTSARGKTTPTGASRPHVELVRDASHWWFQPPGGPRFLSLGVCVVSPGSPRERWDPENPGYAWWQFHPTKAEWARETVERLRKWGVTTVGGWGDHETLGASPENNLWLTPVLHMGAYAGAPWWDMWDPHVIARMNDVAREQILAVRDDPRLLGYYSDNEMGWWNATLWKMTFEHRPESGQRQRLIQLVHDAYQGDWTRMLSDFEAEKADSWSSLRRGGMLFLKPGGRGLPVMRRFLHLAASRYYQLAHDLIRKYDARALILGDRYQSFFYPEVAQAAAPWVDVVSSNLNAAWNDGSQLRCYLDTLHALTGKPVLVSEIYAAAHDNRSGNRNSQGVFPVTPTQSERALAAATAFRQLAAHPAVVGIDWFQYFDEPRHGRDDGENFNFGLVDIHNQPYEPLTRVLADFTAGFARTRSAETRADARGGVPPAPPNPFADFVPTRAIKHWDRERGFVPASSPTPLADLYMCWSPKALYLGVYALDVAEDALYRNRSIPKVERSHWEISVNGRPPVRIRLGLGRDPICNTAGIRVENLSGINLTVRSISAVELPTERLELADFQPGDRVELRCRYATHGGGYSIEWNGSYRLSE